MAEARNNRKTREGIVVSDKMNQTVVVAQRKKVLHPFYKRYVTVTKKFYAHDEKNECGLGDTIRIMETRPTSKLKRWRLIEVLEKAE